MDLNDHEKMDQWLNQKGEILDADQGQMDSCSFCKHLPPRSPVKWSSGVSHRGHCGHLMLIAVWLQLGDNYDNLGSSDVGQIWKAKKRWYILKKMVQNMVKHVERHHHMTMTNCPSCKFRPKFKFWFNRCNILALPHPLLLAIKQMPLIYNMLCSSVWRLSARTLIRIRVAFQQVAK